MCRSLMYFNYIICINSPCQIRIATNDGIYLDFCKRLKNAEYRVSKFCFNGNHNADYKF